ncbi:MAG TPA: hypothetical protein P5205_11065 [Candidatus Paceibacterota bacterium]|nr:hypothetical protein [Candidatus Paceibacterota bacterium]
MSDDRWLEELVASLQEAYDPGPDQLARWQEAVRRADASNDLRSAYAARKQLHRVAVCCGHTEIALVGFAWRLAQFDLRPELFEQDLFELLWDYKWSARSLSSFPEISRAQILETLDDLGLRLQRAGYSRRTEFYCRRDVALTLCDLECAERWHEEWLKQPRDRMSDCPACEQGAQVISLLCWKRESEAIELASPLLEGRLSRAWPPYGLIASLLCPLVRAGRTEQARRHHLRTYPNIADRLRYIGAAGDHLRYLVLCNDLDKARAVFERHFPLALQTPDPADRRGFYSDSLELFGQLRVHHPRTEIHLPPGFLATAGIENPYACSLWEWLSREYLDLATRFDLRNGNDYFRRHFRAANRDRLDQAMGAQLHTLAGQAP